MQVRLVSLSNKIVFREKLIPAFVAAHIEAVPIAKPGTMKTMVVKGKAKWFHKMQMGSCEHTAPSYISRVGWDLWLKQDDIEHACSLLSGPVNFMSRF
jgi:hypothetical protein